MAVVRITLYEGRSTEKKREVAEAITDVLERVCGANRSTVNVIFEDIPRENWVIGGAKEFQKQ